MAVEGSFSFLNLRKQHTNLKLKLLFKIETQHPLTEQNGSTKLLTIDQIQIVKDLTAIDQVQVAPYTLLRSSNLDRQTIQLHKPTTDTQTRQNCLQN